MRSNSPVVSMEPSSRSATIRREFKPQGRSRGGINRTRRVSTTHCGESSAWIWRPVIYTQQIITTFRVKLIKLQLDAVATGHCNTPGAFLVVWVVAGVIRTCKASGETPIFGQRTSCKKFNLPWKLYLKWIYVCSPPPTQYKFAPEAKWRWGFTAECLPVVNTWWLTLDSIMLYYPRIRLPWEDHRDHIHKC